MCVWSNGSVVAVVCLFPGLLSDFFLINVPVHMVPSKHTFSRWSDRVSLCACGVMNQLLLLVCLFLSDFFILHSSTVVPVTFNSYCSHEHTR